MFPLIEKVYMLIRGDRFSRDKLEEIKEEIHELNTEINDRVDGIGNHLNQIQSELKAHIVISANNQELLEQKINSGTVANEMMLRMLNERFDALNLKIDLFKR